MYTGTAYNAPGGYPTTAQAMVDRLIIDTPFLIGVVMSDNYQAVLQNAYRLGIVDPNASPGFADLRRTLILLDNPEGEELLMQALNVPYRGTMGSKVLDAAMAQMRDMANQAGSAPKGLFTLDGIAALATAVGGIANGQAQTNAQERIANQQLQQDFILEQQAGERRAKLIKWGIGIAAVVVVVGLIIYTMRK